MPITPDPKKFEQPKKKRRSAWSEMDWSAWRRFSSSIYINKGTMVAKELSFKGLLRPIPPGECAITSLVCADNHYLYGTTSGKKVHIFRHRGRGENGVVADMGELPGETECRNSLVITRSGEVIGATRSNKPKYGGGWFFRTKAVTYHGNFIQEWGLHGSKIEKVLQPFKNEGIARLTYDRERDIIYGLTDRSGTVFIYDPEKNRVKKLGNVSDSGFSWCLALDNDGILYGAGYGGALWRYSPEVKKVEFTGAHMPTFAGQEVFDMVDSLVFDPASGLLYGGGREHGTLFTYDPRSGVTRFLGKPTGNPRLKALAAGNDGRIYGLTGDKDDLGHMFCYDPSQPGFTDLGIPLATMEARWYGYVFDCMVTGEDGEIYLGQTERISYLFTYFPDIKKVTAS